MPDTLTDESTRLDELERDVQRYRLSRDTWTILVLAIALLDRVRQHHRRRVGDARRRRGDAPPPANRSRPICPSSPSTCRRRASPRRARSRCATTARWSTTSPCAAPTWSPPTSPRARPRELDLSELEPGTYELYCTIPGHTESGMSATFTIGGDGEAAAPRRPAAHAGHTPTAAEGAAQDQAMIESVMAFPAETAGARQPAARRRGAARRHEALRADRRASSTGRCAPARSSRPGRTTGWCPGRASTSRSATGSQVEITNELPIGTDIHWHGIDVPNDQDGVSPITQELVASGETYTYEFTVTEPAIGMYHAHAHAHEAVPNGLFGTMYVGDVAAAGRADGVGHRDPRRPRDRPGPADGAQRRRRDRAQPRRQELPGDRADRRRRRRLDPASPTSTRASRCTRCTSTASSRSSSPRTASRSTTRTPPTPCSSRPASATPCCSTRPSPGTWVWHCHILNHVESADGMFGMVTALVVQ